MTFADTLTRLSPWSWSSEFVKSADIFFFGESLNSVVLIQLFCSGVILDFWGEEILYFGL